MGNIGIKIGHDEEFGAILKGGIMNILNSTNAEAVKIAALEVLKVASNVSYTNINNCNIEMGREDENEGNDSEKT